MIHAIMARSDYNITELPILAPVSHRERQLAMANWPARRFNNFVIILCLTCNIFFAIILMERGKEGTRE